MTKMNSWMMAEIEVTFIDILVDVIKMGCTSIKWERVGIDIDRIEKKRIKLLTFTQMPMFNRYWSRNEVVRFINKNSAVWWEIACMVYRRTTMSDLRFVGLGEFNIDKSEWVGDLPWSISTLLKGNIRTLSIPIYDSCFKLADKIAEEYYAEHPEEREEDCG